jgi:hypothetical protein
MQDEAKVAQLGAFLDFGIGSAQQFKHGSLLVR